MNMNLYPDPIPEFIQVSEQLQPGGVTVIGGSSHSGITVLPNFGPKSQIYVCPYCRYNITTRLRTKATTKTHMVALCLFFCLCWLCCCCPYCIDSCKAINHYCPNCDAFLGTYNK